MENKNEALQKFLAIARYACVYLLLIILMLLNATSLPVFDIGNITPYFLLMGIYYWLLIRPAMLPFYLVFAFGLALDFVTGQTIGLNAFCFLILSYILHGQRRFLKGQSWPVIWVGYSLACLFVGFIHLMVFILMNWAWPGLLPLLATVLVSTLAYPIMTVPMVAISKLFR